MTDKPSPIRETDDEARAIAAGLMRDARFAALGVIHPDTGAPHVTRIGFGLSPDGRPLTLVSDLSLHSRALAIRPAASLLVGEPGPKGDPLTHPRLTIAAEARFVAPDDPGRGALRAAWLATHPKSTLYVDFADFRFVLFEIGSAALNAGFGKAFHLLREDLRVT